MNARTRYAKRSYADYIARKRSEYGDRFDDSDLNPAFIEHYESLNRIKVELGGGETRFGTVGVTTGWKPVFLLMARCTSRGSTYIIGKHDRVVAVQHQRDARYTPINK